MKKKLDTRFPAARIKKIMQADEDVGKIAQAVPVLVSKALELFLQDLCDNTYEITLQRGAKTMSALHLKHCVQSYNVFDFLREIVSKVPDYSHGHSDSTGDHRPLQKRKPTGDERIDSDEELKRSRMREMSHAGSSGRGRGRGRRRGRGRGAQNIERESSSRDLEPESCTTARPSIENNSNPGLVMDNGSESKESVKENNRVSDTTNQPERNFDLNAEVNDNEGAKAAAAAAAATATTTTTSSAPGSSAEPAAAETNHEEYPGWSLSEMDKMAIDPLQLAQLGKGLDEEEDYDEEG